MLKKTLLVLCLCCAVRRPPSALAQFATTIDTTTLTTNSYLLTYILQVPGVWTNVASTVNTNYLITGDLPLAESFKLNQGFTNAWVWAQSQSNSAKTLSLNFTVNSNNFCVLSNNFLLVSNRFIVLSNAWSAFAPGFTALTNAWSAFIGGYSAGGGGDVQYGAPMMFDFDGVTTNITSDGHGDVGLNGVVVTNLETVYLPDDTSDPPAHYGVQWLSPDNGLPVFLVHNFSSGDIFPAEDYITYGGNFFSWSFIDGTAGTRWGYLNVSEGGGGGSGAINWNYAPDNGRILQVTYNGSLSWDSGASYSDGSGNQVIGGSLAVGATFSSDAGNFTSDGSGNVTCLSLTQTSDQNSKTNLVAVDPAAVLQKLLAVPVYRWNFRDYTTTNAAARSVMQPASLPASRWTNSPATLGANPVTLHAVSADIHYGPMAQDWHGRFGGRTNAISVLDLQGVLLAGEQALARQQNLFTNAAGARFALLVNAQTNGFIFVPQ